MAEEMRDPEARRMMISVAMTYENVTTPKKRHLASDTRRNEFGGGSFRVWTCAAVG
jgi:hypothetical protein